jgi:hypothetical protein
MIVDTTLAGEAAIAAVCHTCGTIGPVVEGTRQVKQSAAAAARAAGWEADRWGDVTRCSSCARPVATPVPEARPPPHP